MGDDARSFPPRLHFRLRRRRRRRGFRVVWSGATGARPPAAANPLAADLGPNSVAFNPWVEISPEKITLIAQHADIGQGVGSIQPMMIAEELDLEPGQFEIRFAGPSPAYFNTGFAHEIAPFMAADQSPEAEKARAAALEWLRQSGLQMTGGSSTIPDTYEKLRVAGAVARETLKAAAAKRSGVAVADIRTEAGHVILPDGTKIPYVALSAEAAKIPPVTDVKLARPVAVALDRQADGAARHPRQGHRRDEVRHRSEDGRHGLCRRQAQSQQGPADQVV